MSLKIIWNDICAEKADAIVTPASRFPRVGAGLDKLIHKVAGPRLLEARKKLGNIGPGKVQVSPAYGLKKTTGAKWVIHALGPIWDDTASVRDELILGGCYFRILCKATELKCRTVSVPVMSSGKFGMPMDKALRIAVETIETFLKAVPSLEVKLVGIDSDFIETAQREFGKYCVKSCFSATDEDLLRRELGDRRYHEKMDSCDKLTPAEEDPYFIRHSFECDVKEKSFRELFQKLWNRFRDAQRAALRAAKKSNRSGRYASIIGVDYVTSVRGLSVATGISERAIRYYCAGDGGADRTTKDKAIALCAALRLSLDYSKALLGTCGYRFEHKSPRDVFVRDWIAAGGGSATQLNEKLMANGFEPLDVDEKPRQMKSKDRLRPKKK